MTLSEHLKAYGIISLWNVTHLYNLESILSNGILCKNLICKRSLNYEDISNQRVQSRRHPIYDSNGKIIFDPHDHVPLFFVDNTPMLNLTSRGNSEVILLEISTQAADTTGVRFSNANIAASDHRLYTDPNDLQNLDWNIIKSRRGASFTDEWKRKRAAEVLIPQICPPSFIKVIHVRHDKVQVMNETYAIARNFISLNISVHRDLTVKGVR